MSLLSKSVGDWCWWFILFSLWADNKACTASPWFSMINPCDIFTEMDTQKMGKWPTKIKVPEKKRKISPGWCGSVDWAPTCEPKGCWFDSQSGYMPGLWARSPIGGVREATAHWCVSPSLSPSTPLSLKRNKIFKKMKNYPLSEIQIKPLCGVMHIQYNIQMMDYRIPYLKLI